MREIKFRAWDPKYKEMIYNIHIAPEYDWLVLSDNDALAERDNRGRKKNEEYILMQYTGLKDKNGKEIYEGDILREANIETDWCFPVEWKEGCTEPFGLAYYDYSENYEIIGNIYENPELLTIKP